MSQDNLYSSLRIWRVGEVIAGQYEVLGKLGEGGMGIVHKVHHRAWNIDLAVKSPRPQLFVSASGRENFIREAETWIALNLHPNIASCYYVRAIENIPRLFAECVEGGSLAYWIREHRLYQGEREQALERVLDVAIQFAWGLHAAHEQGLIHQDVKPANVLMTVDGIPRVTDFGLAKARQGTGKVDLTRGETHSLVASAGGMTPAYCSPEQAAHRQLTRRTDLWSWAVSVMEMFAGQITWMSGVVAGEALTALTRQPQAEGTLLALPAGVIALLRHCFQQDERDRPVNMLAAAQALIEVYQQELGRPYTRAYYQPRSGLASEQNNRALSLLDLGSEEAARAAWRRALANDHHHLDTIYNYGLLRWRHGELTDEQFLQQINEARSSQADEWQAAYLISLVHLERGNLNGARMLLQKAVEQAPKATQASDILRQIQAGASSPPLMHIDHVLPQNESAHAVCFSSDGRLALSSGWSRAEESGSLFLWSIHSGQLLQTFPLTGHREEVTSLHLSDDSRLALTGSHDGSARLWDIHSGRALQVFERGEPVTAAWLSEDGRRALLTAGSQIYLWDTTSDRVLRSIPTPHPTEIYWSRASADGRLLLTGEFKTVILWDIAKDQPLLVNFPRQRADTTSIAMSRDARVVLIGYTHGLVDLWDAQNQRLLRTWSGEARDISAMCLSPSGRFALTLGFEDHMRLWDVTAGRCLRTFFDYHVERSAGRSLGITRSIAISPDETRILTGSIVPRDAVSVWEVAYQPQASPFSLSLIRAQVEMIETQARADALMQQAESAWEQEQMDQVLQIMREIRAFPGYGQQPDVIAAWKQLMSQCERVGLRSARLVRTLNQHHDWIQDIVLNAETRRAFSCDSHGSFVRWDLALSEPINVLRTDEVSQAYHMRLSSDGSMLLAVARSGRVALRATRSKSAWDTAETDEECWDVAETGMECSAASLSPSGQFVLVGGPVSADLTELEKNAHKLLGIKQQEDAHKYLVMMPTGVRYHALYAAHERDQVRSRVCIWRKGVRLRTFALTEVPGTIAMSQDERFVLVGGHTELSLWEVSSGRLVRAISLPHAGTEIIPGAFLTTALSPNNDLVLVAAGGMDVYLFDMRTGHHLRTFQGHRDVVTTVCFSPDGRRVVSGDIGGIARLWDLQSGACLHVLEGLARISAITWSPNGQQLLTGHEDGTLRIWELDWEIKAHQPADWDADALPLLQRFLVHHTPFLAQLPEQRQPNEQEITLSLTRRGRPVWNEADLKQLLQELRDTGYGWLRPQGIRRQLALLAAQWTEPPSL